MLGYFHGYKSDVRECDRVNVPTEQDHARAAETIAFISESTEPSEFMENLRVIARLGYVREKHAGLAAAMVVAFDRELTRRAERAAALVSEYVGTEGERIVLDLTVKRTKIIEGAYGITTLVTFADAAGNDLVWFASGDVTDDYADDSAHHVKATIKRHGERNGRKQTTLSRVAPHVEKVKAPRRKKAAAA